MGNTFCCAVTETTTIASAPAKTEKFDIKKSVEVLTYLGLWYFFSGWYNIYNKKALNILKLPWFVATGKIFSAQNIESTIIIFYQYSSNGNGVLDILAPLGSATSAATFGES